MADLLIIALGLIVVFMLVCMNWIGKSLARIPVYISAKGEDSLRMSASIEKNDKIVCIKAEEIDSHQNALLESIIKFITANSVVVFLFRFILGFMVSDISESLKEYCETKKHAKVTLTVLSGWLLECGCRLIFSSLIFQLNLIAILISLVFLMLISLYRIVPMFV